MTIVICTGCQSTSSRHARLQSLNPLDQVAASVQLAEAGDATAVHRLVTLLESQDGTVRMYAILALQRLCGQTHGYVYYQPLDNRTKAVQRWREALRAGRVTVTPPASSATRSPVNPAAPEETVAAEPQ
ncbi:MAG: hypothetical protein ABIG44_13740 [Planctomycetota bacterium]